ncbi:Uncharacterised protein [BD1-7 clade bacterium]|uniref:Thymidine phosphorylase n=1 Tax=BD1-7 clade bacterium TaxID=2029982 RepID=A0A5S9MQ10_9GAMM|nr:Uncharacterised protein [BD1-7 clade bacterium]
METIELSAQHRQLWSTCLNLWDQFARKTFLDATLEFENLCLETTVTATFTRQTELLETIQLLKGHKDAAAEQMSSTLLQLSNDYLHGHYCYVENVSNEQLQLVEDHRLEADIATSNWVRKVYNKHDDVMWQAVGRLLAIVEAPIEHYAQRDLAVIFSPQLLAPALRSATDHIALENSDDIRLIKTFGSVLLDTVAEFYQSISEKLDHARVRQPERPQRQETDTGEDSDTESSTNEYLAPAYIPHSSPAADLSDSTPETHIDAETHASDMFGAATPASQPDNYLSDSGMVFEEPELFTETESRTPTPTDSPAPKASTDPQHPESTTPDTAAEPSHTNQASEFLMNSLMNTLESEAKANQQTAGQATPRPRQVTMMTMSGTPCYGLTRTAEPNERSIVATDYVEALSGPQNVAIEDIKNAKPIDHLVEDNENRFFEQLDRIAQETGRHQITEYDLDYINMVGLLFKFVLDDEEIPDKIKNLISYLHTPYLKLALIDKGFFAETHHPARVLLNTLARAAARWQDDWRIYTRVEEAINTVLSRYEQDTSIFDQVNKQFSHFEKTLQERTEKAELRSLEAMRSTERREKARKQCVEDLREIIGNSPVPEVLVEFIFGLWLEVIVFNRLNLGEASSEYRDCLPPIATLVECFQPGFTRQKLDREQMREHIQQRQANLKHIAEILKAGGVSLLEAQQQLSQIRDALHNTFEGQQLECARLQLPEQDDAARIRDQNLQAQAKQLAQTPFGTWFEFTSDQEVTRLKLVWRSPITQTCMFVNHIGVKARVLSIADLSALLASGDSQIIEPDKRSFFERALKSIINKLHIHKAEPALG